jgi:hypothetical protein
MTTFSATHIISSSRKLMTLLTAAVILLAVAFASAAPQASAASQQRCKLSNGKLGYVMYVSTDRRGKLMKYSYMPGGMGKKVCHSMPLSYFQ